MAKRYGKIHKNKTAICETCKRPFKPHKLRENVPGSTRRGTSQVIWVSRRCQKCERKNTKAITANDAHNELIADLGASAINEKEAENYDTEAQKTNQAGQAQE